MRTIILAFCALLLVATPVKAQDSLSCDKSLSKINKWEGQTTSSDLEIVQAIRQVTGKEARMAIFAVSGDGEGCVRYPSNRLICRDNKKNYCENVTSINADVFVSQFLVTPCADNCCAKNFSRVRILVDAFTVDTPGGRREVLASMRIFNEIDCGELPNRELEYIAKFEVCTDALCRDTVDTLLFHSLGPAPFREWTTLGVEVDKTANTIIYKYGDQTYTFDYGGYFTEEYPATRPHLNSIRVDGSLVNCPNPAVTLMDTTIKDVCVATNASFLE
jgi:hypothetical protein